MPIAISKNYTGYILGLFAGGLSYFLFLPVLGQTISFVSAVAIAFVIVNFRLLKLR